MGAAAFLLSSSPAWADYPCPNDSSVCHYQVNTGSTAKVGPGGQGHSADKSEWIIAPDDKYFLNAALKSQTNGVKKNHCEFSAIEGKRQVTAGNVNVSVVFTKRYKVWAHSETGSGPQAIGRTAFMICTFDAEVSALPP
jgi:hypothetical protein